MKTVIENLALCEDCAIAAVNDDYSGMTDDRAEEVQAAIQAMGGFLAWDGSEPDEFSWRPCDCCHSKLGGRREFFTLLGD